MKKFSLKHLLALLMGIFLLASCKGQEMDLDLPKLPSSRLEGSTWIARVYQGPLSDGTSYYALSFTSPSRYTLSRLDSLGMPLTVEEYGTFTIVQGKLEQRVRLYRYESQRWATYNWGFSYNEAEGTIIDQNRTYRRRP